MKYIPDSDELMTRVFFSFKEDFFRADNFDDIITHLREVAGKPGFVSLFAKTTFTKDLNSPSVVVSKDLSRAMNNLLGYFITIDDNEDTKFLIDKQLIINSIPRLSEDPVDKEFLKLIKKLSEGLEEFLDKKWKHLNLKKQP